MAERLGRYTLDSKLAVGGMAEVFLATQSGPRGFEKVCVVKRMLPHLADEENFVRMFLDEARLAAQLNHPGIAQIFDFGEVNGSYFLAMEYVPGDSLRKIVKDHGRRGAFIPPAYCARMVADAAAALHYAHNAVGTNGQPLKVIHRDVSPQNILLGSTGVVKLIDFGVAKARSATQKTAEGLVKGKFAYMSPEQIRGQPLDQRSDIFSLGLVLYELLATRRRSSARTTWRS
jgi:serine/threonine protein kinase